jgi:hypothetical protein
MGLMARSASIVRYRVRGEIEGPFWESVDEGIRRGAFKRGDSDGDEVGIGWTSIDDFTDAAFDGAGYVRGTYVALSLRVDTARIPAKLLEMQFKVESRKLLEERGQKRLSSAQSRELKEILKERLRSQVLPSIQVFDLIWNTADATLYFGTLGVKPRERMEAHFKKSFGLTLLPIIPYLRAEELLGERKQLLEGVSACSMAL